MKNLFALTILFLNVCIYAQDIDFKNENNFTGLWDLVSINNIYQDGTRIQPYGKNPYGLLVLDKEGTYAIQILKENRPLIVSGNKNTSTPEENAAIVKGFNAHYGNYSVDSENKEITFEIQHASFPNWENKVQKRSYSYDNNEIKYIVTNTTQGGASVIAEVVWRRKM